MDHTGSLTPGAVPGSSAMRIATPIITPLNNDSGGLPHV